MQKMFIISLSLAFYLLSFATALANPGVVIDVKGHVTITQGGKTITAQTGSQFVDDATLDVDKGSSAVIMFSNGATKNLGPGEKYTAAKAAPGKSSGTPLIKGIAIAYNDAVKGSKGPTVHGMVKAAPGQKVAAKSNTELSPEKSKQLSADLKQVDSLGLSADGKSLMQAQVYYKYQQYQKVIDILLPVYKTQNPPADIVKNLLNISYNKMGKPGL